MHINLSAYVKCAHKCLYVYMKKAFSKHCIPEIKTCLCIPSMHIQCIRLHGSQCLLGTRSVPTSCWALGEHTPVEETGRKAPFPSVGKALKLMGTRQRGGPGQGVYKTGVGHQACRSWVLDATCNQSRVGSCLFLPIPLMRTVWRGAC